MSTVTNPVDPFCMSTSATLVLILAALARVVLAREALPEDADELTCRQWSHGIGREVVGLLFTVTCLEVLFLFQWHITQALGVLNAQIIGHGAVYPPTDGIDEKVRVLLEQTHWEGLGLYINVKDLSPLALRQAYGTGSPNGLLFEVHGAQIGYWWYPDTGADGELLPKPLWWSNPPRLVVCLLNAHCVLDFMSSTVRRHYLCQCLLWSFKKWPTFSSGLTWRLEMHETRPTSR